MKIKQIFFLFLFISLVIVFGLVLSVAYCGGQSARFGVARFPDGKSVIVEVADTPAKQAKGLSGRAEIDETYGMLFNFRDYAYHGISMSRMKFSIDILWLDGGVVVYLVENAPTPTFGHKVPMFYPTHKADQVLELEAGFVEGNGVKIGDYVKVTD